MAKLQHAQLSKAPIVTIGPFGACWKVPGNSNLRSLEQQKRNSVMGAYVQQEERKMLEDDSYVPDEPDFYLAASEVRWTLKQHLALRILRTYNKEPAFGRSANQMCRRFKPAEVTASGNILFWQKGHMRPGDSASFASNVS